MAFSCKLDLPLMENLLMPPGGSILPSLACKNAHYDNEDRKSSAASWNSTKCHLEAGGRQRRETKLIKIQDSNRLPHHVQQWEPIANQPNGVFPASATSKMKPVIVSTNQRQIPGTPSPKQAQIKAVIVI